MQKILTETDNNNDNGDDVQRRFRYQHAYGIVLFCAVLRKKLYYDSLCFEHHDDIIGINGNSYEVFQIKTRKPELGYWKLSDDAIKKSIKRFCKFEIKFNKNAKSYNFVSNCDYEHVSNNTKDKKAQANSPIRFIEEYQSSSELSKEKDYVDKFNELKIYCDIDDQILRDVILKLKFIKGPTLSSFDLEISCIHLKQIEELRKSKLENIHAIRDELILKFFYASSLKCDSPDMHLYNILQSKEYNPELLSKIISIEDLNDSLNLDNHYFRFISKSGSINLGNVESQLAILSKKLDKGGLSTQYHSMKTRALSAEQHLLELSIKGEDDISKVINHLEGTVLTKCSDELLNNTVGNVVNGKEMMKSVRKELIKLSENYGSEVYNQKFDCLMGIAAILTSECKVWWSEEFNLEGDKDA